MPLITGITIAGITSYIKFHGLLANATKALQGSAFQQANIKLAQAISKLSPELQMKALGLTSAQILAWQQTQQTQQATSVVPTGSQAAQSTSNDCMIKETFQKPTQPSRPQHILGGKECPAGYVWSEFAGKCIVIPRRK